MKYCTIALLIVFTAICIGLFFLPERVRALAGKSGKTIETTTESGQMIVATTYPIWLFTREIADGTGREVVLLTPANAGCPHDYELTPTDLMKISDKSLPVLLFKNGAGMDEHICKAAMAAHKGIEIIDTSAGIETVKNTEHAEHDHHDDDDDHDGEHEADHERHDDGEHEAEGHHHHHHGGENGHFFASPYEARKIVATIAEALAKSDPANAEQYRENAAKLDKQLKDLGDEFKNQLSPYAGTHIAAQHSVFDYLLRDCGFETPFSIFGDAETSLSPAEITELTEAFQEHGVKVIFTEPQYPDKLANLIAQETGAIVAKLDPVVSGPEDAPMGYYIDTMKNNLELMKKALSGK